MLHLKFRLLLTSEVLLHTSSLLSNTACWQTDRQLCHHTTWHPFSTLSGNIKDISKKKKEESGLAVFALWSHEYIRVFPSFFFTKEKVMLLMKAEFIKLKSLLSSVIKFTFTFQQQILQTLTALHFKREMEMLRDARTWGFLSTPSSLIISTLFLHQQRIGYLFGTDFSQPLLLSKRKKWTSDISDVIATEVRRQLMLLLLLLLACTCVLWQKWNWSSGSSSNNSSVRPRQQHAQPVSWKRLLACY